MATFNRTLIRDLMIGFGYGFGGAWLIFIAILIFFTPSNGVYTGAQIIDALVTCNNIALCVGAAISLFHAGLARAERAELGHL